MTYKFSKVLLHFVRVNVSVGEPSPLYPVFVILKNPNLWKSLELGLQKSVGVIYILLTQASFSPLPSWPYEITSFAAKVFDTDINDLLEVNKLYCFLCAQGFRPGLKSPSGFLLASRFLESRAVCGREGSLFPWSDLWSSDLPCVDCARSSLVEVGLTSDPEMRKGIKAELLKQEETPDEQKEQTDYCSGVAGICLHSVFGSIWELALVPPPPHPSWVRPYTTRCLLTVATWLHVCLSGSSFIASAYSFRI